MDDQHEGINEINGRATLRLAASLVRGHEYDARQEMATLLKKMRLEGYTYEQISQSLSQAGIHINAIDVEGMINELIYESSQDLIKAADDFLRFLSECATHPKNDIEVQTLNNAVKVPRCLPLTPGVRSIDWPAHHDLFNPREPLEHPAIPGLMLSPQERMYSLHLTIVGSNGETREETHKERSCRVNWKKPTI